MRKIHSLINLIYNPKTDRYDTLRDEWEWYDGPIAKSGGLPVIQHTDWAFYDDGTESGSVIIGTENTNPTLDVDTLYLYRGGTHETSGNRYTNLSCQIQYNLNGGGFNTVGTGSNVVKTSISANLTDQSSTTQRITAGQFVNIVNNYAVDNANGVAGTIADPKSNGFECLWPFEIISGDVSDGDSIELKIIFNGAGDLDQYNQTNPTITVNKPVGGISIPVVMNHLKNQGIS